MVRHTNNDFLFRGTKKRSTHVAATKNAVSEILNIPEETRKTKRHNENWTLDRLIRTISSVHDEFEKRVLSGEDIIFNANLFFRSANRDARYLTKKKPSDIARRVFGGQDVTEDLDLRGLMEMVLPEGTKRDRILSDFERGWSEKRIRRAIQKAYSEYSEARKNGEDVLFNSTFFMNSATKDVRNLTKKLHSFAQSAYREKAKNINGLKDLIIIALEDGDEKDAILADFRKSR